MSSPRCAHYEPPHAPPHNGPQTVLSNAQNFLQSVYSASDPTLYAFDTRPLHQPYPLPVELIVMIFHACGFYERFRASWISQYWRSIALGTPAIWASIRIFESTISKELVALALERSRLLPVDMDLPGYRPVMELIVQNIHRLRSLTSAEPCNIVSGTQRRGRFRISLTTSPAPLLQHLCIRGDIVMTKGFLGGGGSLRRLESTAIILPRSAVCPALSTLTHLTVRRRATFPPIDIQHLFTLCRQLQSLTLEGVAEVKLPAGPAPASLTSVFIDIAFDSPDVCSIVNTWRRGHVQKLDLRFWDGGIPEQFGDLLADAKDLQLRKEHGDIVLLVRYNNSTEACLTLARCADPQALRLILSGCTEVLETMRIPRHLVPEVMGLALPLLEQALITIDREDW
ncbi:hypothetical protein AURDEDRAFT_165792 [Auricularia subglabra TFB-10046 SS5]|nr:hypothetical protein AURDEDRAFT_165792 [Auricularia subglabra TFB-10046 SS5]